MSRWDKLFGFLTAAIMLMAFASPASADDDYNKKTISLSVTPTTLSTATTAVYAMITNTGNSNANSFEVDWKTSPRFTVLSATAQGSTGACSAAGRKGPGYSGCIFTKQIPVKGSVTITLTVQVTSQCSAQPIDWFAYAWTGAPGTPSQSFKLNSPIPVTSIAASSCSVNFVTQPADAFVGSKITGSPLNSNGAPVRVRLLQDGTAVAGTAVSVSASPATCATGTTPVTTDASGVAQIAFAGAAPGTCVLTAAAAGYGSADSQQFNVLQQQGNLDCPGGNNTFGTTGAGGLVLNAERLVNVVDPSPTAVGGSPAPVCKVVPYVVSTTCPTGVTGTCTNFVYDPLDQGTHMAFHFRWQWPIEAIPAGGVNAIPLTQQLFINGMLDVNGNPVPIALDFCPGTIAVYDTNPSSPTFGELVQLTADTNYSGPLGPFPRDQDFAAPGTQAGCLTGRNVIQDGTGLKLVEDAWVQGDYTATRR